MTTGASSVAKGFYNVLLHLALPWVLARLLWKGGGAYRARVGERFGRVPVAVPRGAVWFHTVSAGEANAAALVIRRVAEQLPGQPVLVTTMTPAGSARVHALLADVAGHCYAPYDYPWAVSRFLREARPRALVLMETELWPNLVARTRAAGAPVYLVNARLSARSFRGYRRVWPLSAPMIRQLGGVVCQYEDTATRFRELGAANVEVTGSVKFDAELPPDRFGVGDLGFGNAPVWIAGSTHAGEEEAIFHAHRQLLRRHANLRLIVAPRHPERAGAVLRLARDQGLAPALLSDRPRDPGVLVVDVMGTLAHLYGHACVAFVGGSLDETGGHNPIEAAVQGVPVLMGPARFKIEEIAGLFIAAGCLHSVATAADIVDAVGALLADPRRCREEGARAQAVVARNRGAGGALVERLLEWLPRTA